MKRVLFPTFGMPTIAVLRLAIRLEEVLKPLRPSLPPKTLVADVIKPDDSPRTKALGVLANEKPATRREIANIVRKTNTNFVKNNRIKEMERIAMN